MQLDLPVWTIRPNWSGTVLERLEWLTDIMPSDTGAEQRVATRLSPRRSFEFTVNPVGADRTYLDLVLHRQGSLNFYLPLWHDQGVLSQAALFARGRLDLDTRWREFEVGGYAIIYSSTFEYETVKVIGIADDHLTISQELDREWPRGTKVYPLRRATLPADTSSKARSSRIGESVLLFTLNEANDYAESPAFALANYDGAPLLTTAPNRSQEITLNNVRFSDEADGEVGLRFRRDTTGRAFSVQSHNWLIQGREAHAAFRSLLYYLRGRQKMLWLPSFNDDLTLAAEVEAGSHIADVERVGMADVGAGSPIPGRAHVWTGYEALRIGVVAPLAGGSRERVGLVDPTTRNYAPGAPWGFLRACRLDTDNLELHHHTDSDGTMEVSATFREFSNTRDASGTNFLAPPAAVKTADICGTKPADNPCDRPPPTQTIIQIRAAEQDCTPDFRMLLYLGFDRFQLRPPKGNAPSDFFTVLQCVGGPYLEYYRELNEPFTQPDLLGQVMMTIDAPTVNFVTVTIEALTTIHYVQLQPYSYYCRGGPLGGGGNDFSIQVFQGDDMTQDLGVQRVISNTPTTWTYP